MLTAASDSSLNTITYSTAGHPDPIVVTFPGDRLGRQCCQAVWAMIPHAQQGGRWASTDTIRQGSGILRRLRESLDESGIKGFDDPSLSFAHLIAVRHALGERWRSGRAAVAWAVRAYHPDGDRLADQVLGDRLEQEKAAKPTTAYDEVTARTIENAARQRFLARLSQHKAALQKAGVDTTAAGWLLLSAEDIIAVARQASSPIASGLAHYIDTGVVDDNDIENAVSVGSDDLGAAMVLLCLAQNLGPNLAALQSMTPKSIVPVGGDGAVVDMTKSRAATSFRVASPSTSLHTLGGLTAALVGLTRFPRARRRHLATTAEERRHADLLLVADGSRIVLTSPGDTCWGRSLSREIGEGLSMRRLRETANLRGKRATGRGTIIGHTAKTNMVYLAEGMPADELARLVVEAQDDIVSRARRAVARDPDADAARLAEIADTTPDQLVDRGVATCTSAAFDPATEQRCNRGILGCFTCPSGYRTDANIPGLKAAVVLTDAIRSHDPDEWANGPAHTLHAYATAALAQFGGDHGSVDVAPALTVVAALYNEVRG